jgi:hypothetical protein
VDANPCRFAEELFGASTRSGSSMLSSSELGREPGIVKRFHGSVNVSSCRLAEESFGILR